MLIYEWIIFQIHTLTEIIDFCYLFEMICVDETWIQLMALFLGLSDIGWEFQPQRRSGDNGGARLWIIIRDIDVDIDWLPHVDVDCISQLPKQQLQCP